MRKTDIGNVEVIDDDMADVFKKKTPQERLAIAFGLWESAEKLLTNYLCAEHPGWDEERIRREGTRRLSHGAVKYKEEY
ncbi:MAG: hypothetical protein Kow0090_09540 [Myxococcota bacterium]